MTRNGHNTYVPGTQNQWVLNDTYPDKQRLRHPYLFHIPIGRRVPLGHFLSPPAYQGEWRCNTHPLRQPGWEEGVNRLPQGGNGRHLYLIDISQIIHEFH